MGSNDKIEGYVAHSDDRKSLSTFEKRKTKFGAKESTSASAQSSALMKSEAEEVVMAKWRSRSAWSPHQRPGDVSAEG